MLTKHRTMCSALNIAFFFKFGIAESQRLFEYSILEYKCQIADSKLNFHQMTHSPPKNGIFQMILLQSDWVLLLQQQQQQHQHKSNDVASSFYLRVFHMKNELSNGKCNSELNGVDLIPIHFRLISSTNQRSLSFI